MHVENRARSSAAGAFELLGEISKKAFVKKIIMAAVALTAMLLVRGDAAATMSIGVDPGKFVFSLKPGSVASGKIRISNEGDEPLNYVSIYVMNVAVSKDGKATYVKPTGYEPLHKSPAAWISLAAPDPTKVKDNMAYLSLAKGQTADVRFTVRVPNLAKAGDSTAIIFFEVRRPVESGTAVGGRIGSRVRIRVAGNVVEKLILDRFDIPDVVFGDAVEYGIGVRNAGNVDISPKMTISTLSSGKRIGVLRVKPSYIYAGERIDITGKYPVGNAPGMRTLKLSIAYESDSVDKIARVLVIPVWLIGAGATAISLLGIMAFMWMRIRRLKRVAAPEAEGESQGQSILDD